MITKRASSLPSSEGGPSRSRLLLLAQGQVSLILCSQAETGAVYDVLAGAHIAPQEILLPPGIVRHVICNQTRHNQSITSSESCCASSGAVDRRAQKRPSVTATALTARQQLVRKKAKASCPVDAAVHARDGNTQVKSHRPSEAAIGSTKCRRKYPANGRNSAEPESVSIQPHPLLPGQKGVFATATLRREDAAYLEVSDPTASARPAWHVASPLGLGGSLCVGGCGCVSLFAHTRRTRLWL